MQLTCTTRLQVSEGVYNTGVATAAHNIRHGRVYSISSSSQVQTDPGELRFSGLDPDFRVSPLQTTAGATLFQVCQGITLHALSCL